MLPVAFAASTRFSHEVSGDMRLVKGLFGSVQIGMIWLEKDRMRASAADRIMNCIPFVITQIDHHGDIAGRECPLVIAVKLSAMTGRAATFAP